MKKPQSTGMDREDIKAAIRKSGITMNDLARRHEYSISAVRMTLRRPSPAVEAIIAKQIGRRPQDIWPSRYDANGKPLSSRRQSQRHTIRPAGRPHRQKQEVA